MPKNRKIPMTIDTTKMTFCDLMTKTSEGWATGVPPEIVERMTVAWLNKKPFVLSVKDQQDIDAGWAKVISKIA